MFQITVDVQQSERCSCPQAQQLQKVHNSYFWACLGPMPNKFCCSKTKKKNARWEPINKEREYWNYFVFSLGGRRLFSTQSRTHHGKSFSSSVPSRSVIFFLHGPPWEPSVTIEGGEATGNSKGGYTAESFSELPSPSTRDRVKVLVEISFPDGISPFAEVWDPNLCLFLVNQWANNPLRVSLARLTYIFDQFNDKEWMRMKTSRLKNSFCEYQFILTSETKAAQKVTIKREPQ